MGVRLQGSQLGCVLFMKLGSLGRGFLAKLEGFSTARSHRPLVFGATKACLSHILDDLHVGLQGLRR